MKAILFAVASIFVATVSVTPSEARPYHPSWTSAKLSDSYRSTPGRYTRHAHYRRYYAQQRYGARYHRHYSTGGHGARYAQRGRGRADARLAYLGHSSGHRTLRASVHGGRPARWCGWWMRTQKGGGPELNLASNWRYWGHPTGPRIGAVVVWPHHVGMITGQAAGGGWIVKSGNDGGAVRERPRSVAGALFRL
jgi:hypothetical protein